MATLVSIDQIETLPGQTTLLHNINWQQFESILEELGEQRASRIAYFNGLLELWMPLPEHEFDKELIGDMIKMLLNYLLIDYECYGSTTFKNENMAAGIEPDNCFYIQNHKLMIGKRRLNLLIDPPPDLVLEVDVTSKTSRSAYIALGVSELWQYADRQLKIFRLQNGQYLESAYSQIAPQCQIAEVITHCVQLSQTEGRRSALANFQGWLHENVAKP